jgi:ketosteroid isomerase-like protein
MTVEKYEQRLKKLEDMLEYQQKQIRYFQDIQELQELHTNYAYLLLTCAWENIVDLFTDDAVAILHRRGRFEGKAEITRVFKEVTQNNRGKGRDGHLALQPSIQIDGDKATAHWLMYIMMLDPKGGTENMWSHGRHDMEYVRVNGKWKIKYMLFTSPWPREDWSGPTLEQIKMWEKEKDVQN